MTHLNLAALRSAELVQDPFEFTVVPGFLGADSLKHINETYPPIAKGGSYPIESLTDAEVVLDVINELDGAEFQAAVAEKFDVDLSGRPKMYSLRGHTRAKDGQIHTDSKDKIITVLLYLNEDWQHDGGKLRLLRSGNNVDDFVAEVAPDNGTLLIFKRSDTSWHGHHPFEGPRRSLQMNWMVDEGKRGFHRVRHKLSAAVKRLTAS
jgi:SM-20-related protein